MSGAVDWRPSPGMDILAKIWINKKHSANPWSERTSPEEATASAKTLRHEWGQYIWEREMKEEKKGQCACLEQSNKEKKEKYYMTSPIYG